MKKQLNENKFKRLVRKGKLSSDSINRVVSQFIKDKSTNDPRSAIKPLDAYVNGLNSGSDKLIKDLDANVAISTPTGTGNKIIDTLAYSTPHLAF